MSRLDTADLHSAFLAPLGPLVVATSDLEVKPLDINLTAPFPEKMRLYLYNLTAPPGGRPSGEHKIQLIAPGQARGQAGNFDSSGDSFVVLAGYSSLENMVVLWDAALHRNFSWSANAQVKGETLAQASAEGIAFQERHLRRVGETEVVIVVPTENLVDGLAKRASLWRDGTFHSVPVPRLRGVAYRVAAEGGESVRRQVFEVDPDLFDRATDAHARIQNSLHDMATGAHLVPLSPSPTDPQFDIAWVSENDTWIVEVKSLTAQNEVRQIRYAIGQVLYYCFALDWDIASVTPVIALEHRPEDDLWKEICEEIGINLVWPETFHELF